MRHSEKIDKIAPALVKAIAALPSVGKDSRAQAGKFSYTYASLDRILDVVRPVLADHDLAVLQGFGDTVTAETRGLFQTTVLHSSGQYMVFSMPYQDVERDSQKFGSWVSYMRRYCLNAVLAIFPEDDDDGIRVSPSGQEKRRAGNYDEEKPSTKITPDQVKEIKRLTDEWRPKPEQEAGMLQVLQDRYGTDQIFELTTGQAQWLIDSLEVKAGQAKQERGELQV